MILLKQRNFSSFINDTFQFVKDNGKHFFTTYFTLNGGVLVFLILIKTLVNVKGGSFFSYLFILLSYLSGIFAWITTTIYFILYSKLNTHFNYKSILNFIKSNEIKLLKFTFASTLLLIPFILFLYLSVFISIIIIIGPILVVALFFTWYSLFFYEYLSENKTLKACFLYAFKLLKQKIWSIAFSVSVMYLILFIIYFVIIYVMGYFNSLILLDLESFNRNTFFTITGLKSMTVITTLLSVLSVFVQILQGFIYFSQKELIENINIKKEINQIGKIAN